MTIQRVELNKFYDVDIYCPFCGHLALKQGDKVEDIEEAFSPCKHTIFFAYDDDLHYRNEAFDADMATKGRSSEEIAEDEDFGGWDEFTDKVSVTEAVKFASYVGAPSGYGSYIGFVPSYD